MYQIINLFNIFHATGKYFELMVIIKCGALWLNELEFTEQEQGCDIQKQVLKTTSISDIQAI